MNSKQVDIVVLILLLGLASVYSYFTQGYFIGKALFSGAIFTLVPAFYLGYREKKCWKKIIVATLVFGLVFGFFFELVSEYTGSYSVVSHVFPKIIGILPFDNVLGHMMMTFLTIMFYEHFVDRKKSSYISKNIFFAPVPAVIVIFFSLVLIRFLPDVFFTKHLYFYMGILAILPAIFLGITRPKFIKDISVTALYFFILYFVIEIFAVKFRWWIYPGDNYIGKVTIFNLTFPFEELFFWMMFYAASLVSYYELFVDES